MFIGHDLNENIVISFEILTSFHSISFQSMQTLAIFSNQAHLPELRPDLVATLTTLNMHNFSHLQITLQRLIDVWIIRLIAVDSMNE